MRALRVGLGLTAVALLGAGAWALVRARTARPALPPGLSGTLAFVSDRSGIDALYLRHLPDGPDERLTFWSEPVEAPALSPDGRSVAYAMGGRIGVIDLATRKTRFLTVGVDWRDGAPAWRSDGAALVVCARRPGAGARADLHLLTLPAAGGDPERRPLTETPGLDEQSPAFLPSDLFVVFVREDNLFRLDLRDRRARRLTGGLRTCRSPRVLPSARLVYLWTEGKTHGIDTIDLDGRERQTVWQGSVFYRDVVPSPDGRFLAATFGYDLAFHPADALRRAQPELRLLDAAGRELAPLAVDWAHANHSADWR